MPWVTEVRLQIQGGHEGGPTARDQNVGILGALGAQFGKSVQLVGKRTQEAPVGVQLRAPNHHFPFKMQALWPQVISWDPNFPSPEDSHPPHPTPLLPQTC